MIALKSHRHEYPNSNEVVGRKGVSEIPLFQDNRERVRIELWEAGQSVQLNDHKGLEVFVIEGGFVEGGEEFSVQSWLRLPVGQPLDAVAGPHGARIWIKSDHLDGDIAPPGAST